MKLVACLLSLLPALAAERPPIPRFTDPARRAKLEAAFPEVEKVFERFHRQRGTPGLVFGVIIDGDLALVKGFGVRERESNNPVTPDTVFRIASMTKSFTALAVLKLRDEGRLSLADPVSKWIPELGHLDYPTRDTAPLRVRQLLTHGAGFPEDNPWGDRQLSTSEDTLKHWLERGLPFSTPPNTAYEYSNYGFALAGRIVAKASGMPYREYVEKKILAPLGMKASTLEPDTVPADHRAAGYRRSGDGYEVEPSLAHGAFGSMGGMLTSARDLGRYVAFHLSAWPPRDEEDRGPVRRSSVREMQSLARPSSFQASRNSPEAPLRAVAGGYGYGLSVSQDCRFSHIVGHGGGLPGFGSYMLWLPGYGVGVFAMSNLTYAGPFMAADEALDVLKRTGALRPRELPPSPALLSTREAVVGLWRHWDDKRAAALAADNLFLDTAAEERRKDIEKVKADIGECREAGEVQPENLLRGRFRMPCERGWVDVIFTLAPTMPPKLQYLRFAPAKPLDERLKAAAERLASLKDPEDDGLRRRIEAVRQSYGSCRLGETIGGDGKTAAMVRLDCDRGTVDVRLRIDEQGTLRDAQFMRPPNVACVP